MAEENAEATATETAPESSEAAPAEGQAAEGAEGQAVEGAVGGDGEGTGQAETPPKTELDPDVKAWLTNKKFDLDGVDEGVLGHIYKVAGMAKNSESEMSRVKTELADVTKSKLRTASKEEVAETSAEPALSPIETHQSRWKTLIDNQVYLHKLKNETELLQKYPQIHQQLKAIETEEYKTVIGAEVDFKTSAIQNQLTTKERRETLDKEFKAQENSYDENMATAKKADPEIANKMAKAGIADFLGYLSKASNIPVPYFGADPKTFAKMTELATAHDFYANRETNEATLKEQWQKDMLKLSDAELASPSSAEPRDKVSIRSRKMQSTGKGASVVS